VLTGRPTAGCFEIESLRPVRSRACFDQRSDYLRMIELLESSASRECSVARHEVPARARRSGPAVLMASFDAMSTERPAKASRHRRPRQNGSRRKGWLCCVRLARGCQRGTAREGCCDLRPEGATGRRERKLLVGGREQRETRSRERAVGEEEGARVVRGSA